MNDETNTVTTGLSFPGSYGPIADFLGFELDVGGTNLSIALTFANDVDQSAHWFTDVDQEPADELGRIQRHGGVATRAFKTVVFDAEGDAARIETDQTAVGYCHPVRVARQIGQHGFGPGEGFFGVNIILALPP